MATAAFSLAAAGQDTTPPVLVTYSYSPAAFDVGGGDTILSGTVQATDNSSGLQAAFLAFYSPSGRRRVDCHSGAGSFSGTLLAGTFTCQGVFPRYTETGTWLLQFVSISDKAGNTATYTRSQLAAMGLPTTLSLTGTADLTPPSLTTYDFAPASLTIGGGPAAVTGSITATDNLSGLYLAYIAFYSPSGQQRVDCYGTPGDPSSGTPLNGTYSCQGTFHPGAENGQWKVQFVELRDRVDNSRYYTTGELAALGLPTTLQVTAVTDSSPPVLAGLTLSPLNVNTSTGPASISGVVQATDAGTGVKQAVVALFSPSGAQRVDCATAVLAAGTLNASAPCNGQFPQYSESGAWEVRFVSITDHAGNTATVQKATLQQMGLPVSVTVTGAAAAPPPPGLSFSFVLGGSVPAGQQVQVLGAALPWVLQKETGAAWLQLSNTAGVAPMLVTATVNPAGLAAGTYTETLLVRDVIQNRVLARLPVRLIVLASAPLTAAWFDPPLLETIVAEDRQAGEAITAFVHLYWPAPQ
ncbi:MAG: Ig-like domain repeat protein [Bryobacteraceae bacterium]|nr:Ig-like domain repeat protein [Bryobacteraceae bacterium]